MDASGEGPVLVDQGQLDTDDPRRTVGSWAQTAAASGGHQDALSWLRALSVVFGELPQELASRRRAWYLVVSEKADAHNRRRSAGRFVPVERE